MPSSYLPIFIFILLWIIAWPLSIDVKCFVWTDPGLDKLGLWECNMRGNQIRTWFVYPTECGNYKLHNTMLTIIISIVLIIWYTANRHMNIYEVYVTTLNVCENISFGLLVYSKFMSLVWIDSLWCSTIDLLQNLDILCARVKYYYSWQL